MKVTVRDANPNKENQFEFPVLMEWIGDTEESKGSVVLFLSRQSGITIKANSAGFAGSQTEVFNKYCPCDNKSVWRKFEGVVELSN